MQALCASTSHVGVRMKFGVPWSVKGIRPEARETAEEAARRSGMPLGEWLNSVILQQAEQEACSARRWPMTIPTTTTGRGASAAGRPHPPHRAVPRTRPGAYAPKRSRKEAAQLAELIGRLDRRLDQFARCPARRRFDAAERCRSEQ